jgi:hypothetical protein
MAKISLPIPKQLSILGIVAIGLLIFVVGISLISSRLRIATPQESKDATKIEAIDPKTGKKIIFGKDGLVTFVDENGNTVSEIWDAQKIASFWEYVNENFVPGQNGQYTVTIGSQTGGVGGGGDELISVIGGGGGPGPGGTGGGEVGDLFASPTPVTTGGTWTPLPWPTLPPPAPSWCKFWRLSYCADLIEFSPAPSSTPTSSSVALPPTCTDTGNKNTGKTVITNELCVNPNITPEP